VIGQIPVRYRSATDQVADLVCHIAESTKIVPSPLMGGLFRVRSNIHHYKRRRRRRIFRTDNEVHCTTDHSVRGAFSQRGL